MVAAWGPGRHHRDSAFDSVKGMLVLFMVVYHVMSITATAGVEGYRYIRFVSGSFIFMSGFIVSRFFAGPFERDPGKTSRGLVNRGVKVLLMFTVLNGLIYATGFGNLEKLERWREGSVANAAAVYLTGDGDRKSVVILLPIA